MRVKISMLLFVSCFLLTTLEGCSRKGAALPEHIKAELDGQVAQIGCMPTDAFPFTASPYGTRCSDCGKLVDAGLLTAEFAENEFDDSVGPRGAASRASVTYNLSELGERTYVPSDTGETAYGASQFCFGHARLTEITRVYGPVKLGGVRMLGIRYVVQLDDPDPYIFDPRAEKLGIVLPVGMPGKPVFYPEQDVTAVINLSDPNDFHLDGSLHVGPMGGN